MAAREAARGSGVDAVEVVGTILQALLSLPRPARLKELEDSVSKKPEAKGQKPD